MKYNVRAYQDSDIAFLQEYDFLHSLELQYREDYERSMMFTVLDWEGDICGVVDLSYHKSWWDKRREASHFLQLNICASLDASELYQIAIDYAWMILEEKLSVHAGCPCGLMVVCRMGNLEEMQKYLEAGFSFGETQPILRYYLDKPINISVPAPYEVKLLEKTSEEVQRYINATACANEGVPDSIDEYFFHCSDDSFDSYYITDGKEILAGISVWDMEDGGIVGNLFVLPAYRSRNFGDILVRTALEEIRARGYDMAVTRLSGSDEEAMQLYLSFGFELDSFSIQLEKLTVG